MPKTILRAGVDVRVYPVAHMVVNRQHVRLFLQDRGFEAFDTDAGNESDLAVELAGRVCYMSFGENRRKAIVEDGQVEISQSERYVDHIIEVGHGSVMEHPTRSFIITGIDRNLTHELVRHRVGVGYSQLSSRYVDLAEYGFIVPERIAANDSWFAAWRSAVDSCLDCYRMVAGPKPDKSTREDAMCILPGCVETIMYFTANTRALRHIFYMRGALGAKKDIRAMAVAIYKLVRHEHSFRHIELCVDPERGEYLVNSKPKV